MKRGIFFLVAAATAIGLTTGVARWVGAQQQDTKPAPATLKVGVVNINKILKGFDKANTLGDQLLTESKAEGDRLLAMRNQLETEAKAVEKIADPALKETKSKELRKRQGDMNEMELDARKRLTEKQSAMASEVNKDIQKVIEACAKSWGLELILSYPDAVTAEELSSPGAAMRRLGAPAAMPIYVHPQLDITDLVVQTLNKWYPKTAAGNGAPVTPAGATGGANR